MMCFQFVSDDFYPGKVGLSDPELSVPDQRGLPSSLLVGGHYVTQICGFPSYFEDLFWITVFI